MAQEDKVECPECGYDVGTKENGTRIKAHKVDGEKCGGSDELVQRDEPTTDGIDKGGSYEAQDSPQGSRDETDDKNDPETPKEPETGTQGVAPSETRAFNHVIQVLKPCPSLHQAPWHVANAKMASNHPPTAAHAPTAHTR